MRKREQELFAYIFGKYGLMPEVDEEGVVKKGGYMAETKSNISILNSAIQKTKDAEEVKKINKFLDIHIQRNYENQIRKAKHQRKIMAKSKVNSYQRGLMEERAQDIEKSAEDYRTHALYSTHSETGEKLDRTLLGKAMAYTTPQDYSIRTESSIEAESRAKFDMVMGYAFGNVGEKYQASMRGLESEFRNSKKREDLDKILNRIKNMEADYADEYWDSMREWRKEKDRWFKEHGFKSEGEARRKGVRYPTAFGDSYHALLIWAQTMAKRNIEKLQLDKIHKRKMSKRKKAQIEQLIADLESLQTTEK